MTTDLATKLAAIKDACRRVVELAQNPSREAARRTFTYAAARALLVAIEGAEEIARYRDTEASPSAEAILEAIADAWQEETPKP